MRSSSRRLVVGAGLALVCWSSAALAGVELPWSTTFDCPEWTHYNNPLVCDGIDKKGAWTADPGAHYEEIISEANFPGGGGGRGKRHWIGNGTNNNSGGIKIDFTSSPDRLWVRWYQRWQAGFTSNWGTFKNLWFERTGGGRIVFHTGCAGSPDHSDGVDLNPPDSSTCVREVAFGHDFYQSGVSDGSWQCFEVHLDIPNTTWKVWINGKLVAERNDVDFAGAQSIDFILAPVNTKEVNNPSPPMYVDMDDFVINTSGYIGPIPAGEHTCATDAARCESAEECAAAWPAHSWCPEASPPCTPSLCSAGRDAGGEGNPDAGGDAGAGKDTGAALDLAAASGDGQPQRRPDECSCSAPGNAQGFALPLLGWLIALSVTRWRRRHRG